MLHLFPRTLKESVVRKSNGNAITLKDGKGLYKGFFFTAGYPLTALLLQNNKVAPHFCTSVL